MRNKCRQLVRHGSGRAGATLVEMTVVVSIAALMVGLTIPMANMLINSYESESGAKSIISSALASARAIAAKEQRYAGIRFQKRYDPDPLNESQYIIFIVQDPNITANGFRAIDSIQPIKLPDSIGLMDLFYNPSLGGATPDISFNNSNVLRDTTTFSIIFSPSGKLVIRDVRVRNRDGQTNDSSNDDIFNTIYNVGTSRIAMFLQDDYFTSPTNYGLGQESSRNNFVIYDTKKLKQTDTNLRWTNYLSQLKQIYINPYTGTIINEK